MELEGPQGVSAHVRCSVSHSVIHPCFSFIPSSGRSSLSLDGTRVLVHNLWDGLDLYAVANLRKQKPNYRTFLLDNSNELKNYSVSVAFIHDGSALVSGANSGRVCVWEAASGDHFQQLDHNGKFIIPVRDSNSYDGSRRYCAVHCCKVHEHL